MVNQTVGAIVKGKSGEKLITLPKVLTIALDGLHAASQKGDGDITEEGDCARVQGTVSNAKDGIESTDMRIKNMLDRLSSADLLISLLIHHDQTKGVKSNIITGPGANVEDLLGHLHTSVTMPALKLKDSKKVIGEEAKDALLNSLKAMCVKNGKLLTDTNGQGVADLSALQISAKGIGKEAIDKNIAAAKHIGRSIDGIQPDLLRDKNIISEVDTHLGGQYGATEGRQKGSTGQIAGLQASSATLLDQVHGDKKQGLTFVNLMSAPAADTSVVHQISSKQCRFCR